MPRDADAKAIKDAFRRLARRYHPDTSTEPDAEERFTEIAEAYGVLSDPARRRDYDASGWPGWPAPARAGTPLECGEVAMAAMTGRVTAGYGPVTAVPGHGRAAAGRNWQWDAPPGGTGG